MDFLSPQSPNASPTQPTVIDQLLSNPRIAAGVLQAGVNLMQPAGWGQNFASQLGSAIGGGAAAAQRQEAEDIKQQEANSKEDLRTAQAGAAEARANTAGARSDTAAQRLAFMQNDADRKREIADQALRLHYHQLYNKRVKDITDSTPIGKKPAIPTPEEFFNSIGIGHVMNSGSSEAETTGGDIPTATPGDKERPPGRYNTPKGVLYWDGKGWH